MNVSEDDLKPTAPWPREVRIAAAAAMIGFIIMLIIDHNGHFGGGDL